MGIYLTFVAALCVTYLLFGSVAAVAIFCLGLAAFAATKEPEREEK